MSPQRRDYDNNDYDDGVVDDSGEEENYYNTRNGPYPDTGDETNNTNSSGNNDCDYIYRVVCPASSNVQNVIRYDTAEQQRQYYYNSDPNHNKNSHDTDDNDEERTYPAESSFDNQYQNTGSSLAGRDSLALEPDESIILEHPLPNTQRKAKNRRLCMYGLVCMLLVGIITVTALFAIENNEGRSVNTDESKVGSSIESDNIFDGDSLPGAYYLLKPKVHNATALLDPNTPEGQAFRLVATEDDDIAYNAADQTSTDLNLIQRYSLLTLYFGAGKKENCTLICEYHLKEFVLFF
jgi:hypothetical protein